MQSPGNNISHPEPTRKQQQGALHRNFPSFLALPPAPPDCTHVHALTSTLPLPRLHHSTAPCLSPVPHRAHWPLRHSATHLSFAARMHTMSFRKGRALVFCLQKPGIQGRSTNPPPPPIRALPPTPQPPPLNYPPPPPSYRCGATGPAVRWWRVPVSPDFSLPSEEAPDEGVPGERASPVICYAAVRVGRGPSRRRSVAVERGRGPAAGGL